MYLITDTNILPQYIKEHDFQGTLGAKRAQSCPLFDTHMICSFYLLGPFAIKDSFGRDITPKSQKTCAMLAMLILSPRATRTRVWLRDKLWSDRGEAQGASSLRQALLDARKSLEALGVELISSDKNSISLKLDNINLDLNALLQGGHSEKTKEYSIVNALNEDLLEGMDIRDPEFEQWLTLERQAWEQRIASFLQDPSQNNEQKSLPVKSGHKVRSTIVAIRLEQSDNYRNSNAFNNCISMLQDVSEGHGGRVFKISTEHVLLEFGRPYDAVKYSIDIVKHLNHEIHSHAPSASFDFGIGINSGLVHLHGSTLSGTGCDIALAISNNSGAGEILISDTSINDVKGKVDCRFINKNKCQITSFDEPIDVSHIVEGRDKTKTSPRPNTQIDTYTASAPCIGVLPFRVLDSSVQEYMSEGIADDIILALSRNHWLSVISRNSSFSHTPETNSSSAAIKELNLDYLVAGSVKVISNNAGHVDEEHDNEDVISINVTLEQVSSKRILWSESFSVNLNDIMSLQETIATKIAAHLLPNLSKHEQVRAFESNIDDLTTWQLVHRGHWHLSRRTSSGVAKAKYFYEQALQLDEFQSEALIALAWWYFWTAWSEHGFKDAKENYDKALVLCRKALLMNSSDGRVHAFLGVIAIMRSEPTKAIHHCDEAIRLNPSDSLAYSSRGSAHLMKGNAHLAPKDICKALALNPFDHYRFHKLAELAAAYYFSGQYEKALEAADSSSFLSPRYWYAHLIKLACLLDRGKPGDKQRALEVKSTILKLKINISEANIRAIPFEDRNCVERLVTLYQECAV